MSFRSEDVFINCPFDDAYKHCFEAVVFTVVASGFRIRCALEETDSGDIRMDKLCRLISESNRSIHDLSRVELGSTGLPRFNMPFELGLYHGAKRFGGKAHRRKTALILVRERYKLPIYLSDGAGGDPEVHNDDPREVIRQVRKYLHQRPDGSPLPGAAHFLEEFVRFKRVLPEIAAELKIAPTETDAFRDYRVFVDLLVEFLRRV